MIGIIFATIREARPFLQKLGINDDVSQYPVFFKFPDQKIVVCICGMGMKNAANGVEELIKSYKVSSVVNAGIAGALNGNFNVGHIVSVAKVVNASSNSYYILNGADLWANLPPAVLITSPEPVFNGSLRSRLSEIADIVDMECAEIARACKDKKIQFSAIKAVSDLAGENDRAKLFENIDHLSVMISELLSEKLRL